MVYSSSVGRGQEWHWMVLSWGHSIFSSSSSFFSLHSQRLRLLHSRANEAASPVLYLINEPSDYLPIYLSATLWSMIHDGVPLPAISFRLAVYLSVCLACLYVWFFLMPSLLLLLPVDLFISISITIIIIIISSGSYSVKRCCALPPTEISAAISQHLYNYTFCVVNSSHPTPPTPPPPFSFISIHNSRDCNENSIGKNFN